MTEYTSSISTLNLLNTSVSALRNTTAQPLFLAKSGNPNFLTYIAPVSQFANVKIETDLYDFLNNTNTYPYGVYYAGDYGMYGNYTLPDRSSNNHHAVVAGSMTATANLTTSSLANGEANQLKCITGISTNTITWPDNSISATANTICCITRYDDGTQRCVLVSSSGKEMFGHNAGLCGYAKFANSVTSATTTATTNNFMVTCCKSGANTAKSTIVNNKYVGTAVTTSALTADKLTINGNASYTGNFGFTYLIMWQQSLTDDQLQLISNAFMTYTFNYILVPQTPLKWTAGTTPGTSLSVDLSSYPTTSSISSTYQAKLNTPSISPSGTFTITNNTPTIVLPTTYSALTITTITTNGIYVTSGSGSITLQPGGSGNVCGYIEFKNASGTRRGYLGYAHGDYLYMAHEAGCLGYRVAGDLYVDGTITGNATTSTTSSATNILNSGNSFKKNEWYNSSDGLNRFHFSDNSYTYIRGNGRIQFRIDNDSNSHYINSDGFSGNAATATTANNTNTLNSGNCFNANEWYNSSDGSLRIYFERNSRMLIHYNTYFYHYMEVAGGIYASGTLSTSAGRIGVAGIDGEHVWWNNSFSGPVSIKAAGDILTGGHILMSSDIRIKKNIININDDFALQKILTIEPKKYNYIDTRKGFNDVYGFIAQQIKQVIPEAILLQDIVVPNIYGVYNLNSNVITINNSNLYLNSNVCLNINDKIQIYDYNNKEFNCKIIDINDNQITIDTYITGSNCLVYGTDVNDFHTIDKHYIYTLNVGATQELYKIIQKQQKEIDTLNYKLNKLLETLNITLD